VWINHVVSASMQSGVATPDCHGGEAERLRLAGKSKDEEIKDAGLIFISISDPARLLRAGRHDAERPGESEPEDAKLDFAASGLGRPALRVRMSDSPKHL